MRDRQELLGEGRCPRMITLLHGKVARAAQGTHPGLGRRACTPRSARSSQRALATLAGHMPEPIERPREPRQGFGLPRAANHRAPRKIAVLGREPGQKRRLTRHVHQGRKCGCQRQIPLRVPLADRLLFPAGRHCSSPNSRVVSSMR